ncbi:LPXTG cell wall anchor domain-containing protein [Kitasatospora sp. NPDC018058]|uniref:LPXTG cell wall anchor domain-containing protein n=1 Tax=Kitasatospora sp. NPDC018058 TaxID=3364025 RepID=UPI0037BF0A2B
MRSQSRRLLAAAATATLVSGLTLASAPAVHAAPTAGTETQGPQVQFSPVTVAFSGMPSTVKAGGAPTEFTAILKNTADHQMDVLGSVFTIADTIGSKPSQFKLEYQAPGGTQWRDAEARGGINGGVWDIDRNVGPHLAAGSEAAYRLRLTVTADAPAGRVGAGFNAIVSDPTLPPEQRISNAMSGYPGLVIVPAVTPTTPASTPAATADVRLDGMPATFTAGGEAKPFKLVLTNNSGKDIRLVPAVVFQGQAVLPSGTVTFEFQGPNGEWAEGAPGGDSDHPAWLYIALRAGSKDAAVITLPKGGTRTINVRLAFTKDTPVLSDSLVAIAGSLPGTDESAAEAFSPKVDFTIEAAAGPTGIPAPTSPATSAAPTTPAATADPSTAPVVPAAQATTGAPSPAAAVEQTGDTARAAAAPAAPAAGTGAQLASTGGSSSAPTAITGATAIALGVGTLVVARRRRGAQGAGN